MADWTGITRYGLGWRASVSRGHGVTPVRRSFPIETEPAVMQAWRADIQHQLSQQRSRRIRAGTFAADAKRYLVAVKGMPTITDRQREIALWVEVFGDRLRQDIHPAEIRAQRDAWLTERRSSTDARPVARATVNKRLRALSNLYAVLDPRGPNPVRDVPELSDHPRASRAIDYATIDAVIDAMPDVTRSTKGEKRQAGSKAKARLRVLAYTGWSNKMLASLTPADVDLERGLVRLPPRNKGRGVPGAVVPLLPQAVEALKTFAALQCWGAFSRRSLLYSWQRALKRLNLPPARVYDLRHSFGTALLAASKDEGAAQALMQHADAKTTRGYTGASVPPRLIAARDALGARLREG